MLNDKSGSAKFRPTFFGELVQFPANADKLIVISALSHSNFLQNKQLPKKSVFRSYLRKIVVLKQKGEELNSSPLLRLVKFD